MHLKNYKTVRKSTYFNRISNLYFTSTVLGICGGIGVSAGTNDSDQRAFVIAGLGCFVSSLVIKLIGDQQFRKIGKLSDIERAADKAGIKIKF